MEATKLFSAGALTCVTGSKSLLRGLSTNFFFTPFQSFLYFSIRAAAQTKQDVRWLGPTLTSRNLWNAGLASLAILTASLALRKLSMYAEYILARVSLENWRGEEEQETVIRFMCLLSKIAGSGLLNVKICCISFKIHVILKFWTADQAN